MEKIIDLDLLKKPINGVNLEKYTSYFESFSDGKNTRISLNGNWKFIYLENFDNEKYLNKDSEIKDLKEIPVPSHFEFNGYGNPQYLNIMYPWEVYENISYDEAVEKARAWEGLDNQDYAKKVTAGEVFKWNETGTYKIAAYDFGIKYNILRSLAAHDMQVTVVPAGYDPKKVMEMNVDGVFLSNGPADPSSLTYAIEAAKYFTGKKPLMGICLGHQIMGISAGCSCYRLKFGHHGLNHPIKNLLNNQVEITSQNHNFALSMDNIPSCLEVTHINMNDNTLEGIRHKTEPFFSVQYHPEAAPGPNDSLYLFEIFKKMMER